MEPGIYILKKEFGPMLNIPNNQLDRRKEELYEWLKNFFEYEIIQGCPIRIHIKAIIGEYQPLPSKKYDNSQREKIVKEAKEDYSDYTIAALGTEFKPNSKSKIARDAINDFGYERYNHTNTEWIARKYIKEPFDNHAETNNKSVWVYYSDYTLIDDETLAEWRDIMSEEHISEQEAANAFYRQEQGQDVTKEKRYYKNAVARFKEKYGDIPVLVKEWKNKN